MNQREQIAEQLQNYIQLRQGTFRKDVILPDGRRVERIR